MSIGVALLSEPPLIPVWFYAYSAVVYSLSAVISLLISFFSFRLYRTSSIRMNLPILFGFLLLGLAFSSLTFSSLYTYFYKPYFEGYHNLRMVNKICFNFYYVVSLIAYLSLSLIYIPIKFSKRLFILYIPLWYIKLTEFNIASIIILGYVTINSMINFSKKVNLNSFLVMLAFIGMTSFHSLLLLSSFDIELYLIAHLVLSMGFVSFLTMLIRVSRE